MNKENKKKTLNKLKRYLDEFNYSQKEVKSQIKFSWSFLNLK